MKTCTVDLSDEKIAKLDEIARFNQEDRDFVINEAIDRYQDLNAYHVELIAKGFRQSETEQGIGHDEVVAQLNKRKM